MSTIGERIKELRNDFSLKQTEFGERIKVTHAHISHLEKDSVLPSDMLIKLIAIEFNVNEEWLRSGTGDKYVRPAEKALNTLKNNAASISGTPSEQHISTDSRLASYYRDIVRALQPGGAAIGYIPFMQYPEIIRMLNYMQLSYLSAEEIADPKAREREKLKLELRFQLAFNNYERVMERLYESGSSTDNAAKADVRNIDYHSSINAYPVMGIRESSENYQGDDSCINVPTLGKVAAGIPIAAIEDSTDLIPVPRSKHIDFALVIKGDSMEPEFPDNSIVFVKRQATLENGEIGIIMIDNEVTCKKFYKLDDHIELRSINKRYSPIVVNSENIRILGKAVKDNQ